MNTKRIITAALFAAVASGASAQEPVIWWDFNAGASTVNKGTGGGAYNPAFTGTITFEAGINGQGARFTGSTGSTTATRDHISTGYTYGDAGTIELWYKPDQFSSGDLHILDNSSANDQQWRIYLNNATLRFQNGTSPEANLTYIHRETNTWFHIVATWDIHATPAQSRLYINGAWVAAWNLNNLELSGNTIYLGGGRPNRKGAEGIIDEVKIYDTALPGTAIHARWLAVTHADQTPVIHLPLANGSVTNIGTGGSRYDGTISGSPALTNGPYGTPDHAFVFNGIDDSIAIPYVTTRSQTVTMWYYLYRTDGGNVAILDCGGNYLLRYIGGNYQEFQYVNSENWATLGANMYRTDGISEWVFLTTTRDANTGDISLYINGQLVTRKNISSVFNAPGTDLYIGGSGGLKCNGLADVKIYETCLPYDRIREIYAEATSTPPGQMRVYLPLDGTAENVVNQTPAVIKGTPDFVNAKVGQGASFTPSVIPPPSNSGGDAYIAIPNAIGSAGTIALWYYHRGDPGTLACIFDNACSTYDWRLSLQNDTLTFQRSIWGGFSSAFTSNSWHHIVITWVRPAQRIHFYVDGQHTGNGDLDALWITPDPTLYLGSYHAVNGAANGVWDEVRVYDYILAPEEVKALYDNTNIYTPPPPPGTIIILK